MEKLKPCWITIKNNVKICRSEDYNYMFSLKKGTFARWGKTKDDDPDFSPFGPEIADIEITTTCHGVNGKLCPFCYKANTPNGGEYMTLETFKEVFHALPPTITQIAFGVDSQCTTNPDIWDIMKYAREHGVIPNVTVAQITGQTADKLAEYCGAVAVSRYEKEDPCYDSVQKLTERGMQQVNIHAMISRETLKYVHQTIRDRETDPRLKDMYAIVFLSLKQKGRGIFHKPLAQEDFNELVLHARKAEVPFGFDSCSAPKFLQSIREDEKYAEMAMCTEPCESSLFSVYVNVKGEFYPCSFCEGYGNWIDGLSMLGGKSFMKDIWYHPKTVEFRKKLLANTDDIGTRCCHMFDV